MKRCCTLHQPIEKEARRALRRAGLVMAAAFQGLLAGSCGELRVLEPSPDGRSDATASLDGTHGPTDAAFGPNHDGGDRDSASSIDSAQGPTDAARPNEDSLQSAGDAQGQAPDVQHPGGGSNDDLPTQGVYEGFGLNANWKPRLDEIAASGFRVVINYRAPGAANADRAQLKAYADYAHGKGLQIAWAVKSSEWWDGTYSDADKMSFVNYIKDHPATWGWYVTDDDKDNSHKKIVAWGQRIAAVSTKPRLGALGSNLYRDGSMAAVEPASTHLGMFVYPIGKYDGDAYKPGTETYKNTEGRIKEAVAFAKSKGKPHVAITQANNVCACYPQSCTHFVNPHWPSAAEIKIYRDQWLRIAKDAGVDVPLMIWYSYFDIKAHNPAAWTTLVQGAFAE